jgi:hypothetical protein
VKSLATARKRFRKFQEIVKRACGDKAFEENRDISGGKGEEIGCSASEAPQHEVENDWRERVRKLAQALDVLTKMVHTTLHKDMALSKKLARWVTKLFYEEMKKERVRTWTCKAFVVIL